ncbi:MAG: DUF4411 family protein [Lachnospiraceae bacterium]|nr:DUF4411 family protein [Lachnospiraceae bacterium]
MVDTNEKFLIDSSSFMTPYKFYYAFDLVPSYWKKLSICAETGRIILLDIVKTEIDKGKDSLADWIKNNQSNLVLCNHVEPNIIKKYQEILQYIETCGYYNDKALNAWSKNDVADPWLIAAATVHGYTIITNEVSAGTLSNRTPSKNAKIPDVAKAFNVKTEPIFYMMRKLNIKI